MTQAIVIVSRGFDNLATRPRVTDLGSERADPGIARLIGTVKHVLDTIYLPAFQAMAQ
jgi:hypothetical protein